MNRRLVIALAASAACAAYACSSSDDSSPAEGTDAGDAGGRDVVTNDDAGSGGDTGGGGDAAGNDAACPSSWTARPTVDPSLAVPADGGAVVLHGSATGTQNYECQGVMPPILVPGSTAEKASLQPAAVEAKGRHRLAF